MNSKLKDIRAEAQRLEGERRQIERSLKESKAEIKSLKEQSLKIEEAQTIIQTVAKMTQEELEFHVSELVSLAMEAVFPEPYKLNLDFELRRNKSEADLTFSRGEDDKIHPLSAAGGGAVDVASFALRVALWSLKQPKNRNTLILDEPFRFVSRDLQDKACAMLKEVSKRLGLQLIIVTHETDLMNSADKTFNVKIRKGVSHVT